jgi:hypothetical protein
MNSTWNKHLQAILVVLCSYHNRYEDGDREVVHTYFRCHKMPRNEEQHRPSPFPPCQPEVKDSGNDGETESHVDEHIMTPSSSSDGGDEYRDNTTTLGLRCKQHDQKSPKQQALDAHTAEAHPSEALKAEILKLVDNRFNALVEKQRGDASEAPGRAVQAPAKAESSHQQTVEVKEVVPQETSEARAKRQRWVKEVTPQARDTMHRWLGRRGRSSESAFSSSSSTAGSATSGAEEIERLKQSTFSSFSEGIARLVAEETRLVEQRLGVCEKSQT